MPNLTTPNLTVIVGFRKRPIARLLLFLGPIIRHIPYVNRAAHWIVQRNIFIDGERTDRLRDRLKL